MTLIRVTFSLVALILAVNSAPATGATETYIVTLKRDANLNSHITQRRAGFEVRHVYDAVLNGYAAALTPEALKALRLSDEVQSIEKDQVVSINQNAVKSDMDIRARVDRDFSAHLMGRTAGGAGVDIYILDTGITVSKSCFSGRASWGYSADGYGTIDGSGHGTAMAASAICAETGATATSAKAIAVKVLSDSGSGTVSQIISGVNWVATQPQTTMRPAIAVLALGGGASAALDSAVKGAISKGVHTVVTAGFSNTDLSNTSPARVPEAVTVGSLPRSKVRPSNSNYGSLLDVWSFYPIACPTDIPGCTTPTNAVSYVASYMAVAIGSYGNKTPTALAADLINHAVPDVTGVPSGTTNKRAVPW